jgi:hypothetical protein
MSGGLIQKLQAAEIQRDKYKAKVKKLQSDNYELIRIIKKLQKQLDKVKKFLEEI